MATWPPYVDDDGTGTTGTPTDAALFNAIKAYIDGAAGTPWAALTGITWWLETTSGTPTWTAQVNTYAIDLSIKRVFLDLHLTGGATSTPGSNIFLDLPTSLPPIARQVRGGGVTYWTGGLTGVGTYDVWTVPTRRIVIQRDIGGTAWPTFSGLHMGLQLSYPY